MTRLLARLEITAIVISMVVVLLLYAGPAFAWTRLGQALGWLSARIHRADLWVEKSVEDPIMEWCDARAKSARIRLGTYTPPLSAATKTLSPPVIVHCHTPGSPDATTTRIH